MDMALLLQDLERDEGFRAFLYDDANDTPIRPGVTVKGHPTAGIGFALDVSPLTLQECLPILAGRASAAMNGLLSASSWVADLSEPRQRALYNMAYQLGVTGLLKFNTFMSLMQQGQFDEAADDLVTTKWYTQSGNRAKRIQTLIRSG